MRFRDKLEATLRAVAPLFEVPGVIVGGSEVPNLLQPGAASTLAVSQAAKTALEERVRAVRARAEVRRWEYRQRNTSHGVWHRVRRFLTFAAEVWVVSDEATANLVAEGYAPDPAGPELEPVTTLLCVPRAALRGRGPSTDSRQPGPRVSGGPVRGGGRLRDVTVERTRPAFRPSFFPGVGWEYRAVVGPEGGGEGAP